MPSGPGQRSTMCLPNGILMQHAVRSSVEKTVQTCNALRCACTAGNSWVECTPPATSLLAKLLGIRAATEAPANRPSQAPDILATEGPSTAASPSVNLTRLRAAAHSGVAPDNGSTSETGADLAALTIDVVKAFGEGVADSLASSSP